MDTINKLCCCCKNNDDKVELNLNINCSNTCCQKNVSDSETKEYFKENLLRRFKSSLIRRRKEAIGENKLEPGTSIKLVKSTMDLQSSQTGKEIISETQICE